MFLGRVIRPGRDPQWLGTDRGYALAWARNKAETCSCGTRHDEWDPKLGGDRDAYVAETAYCRGHELLATHQDGPAVPKDKDGRPLPGFLSFLRPRTDEDDDPDDD